MTFYAITRFPFLCSGLIVMEVRSLLGLPFSIYPSDWCTDPCSLLSAAFESHRLSTNVMWLNKVHVVLSCLSCPTRVILLQNNIRDVISIILRCVRFNAPDMEFLRSGCRGIIGSSGVYEIQGRVLFLCLIFIGLKFKATCDSCSATDPVLDMIQSPIVTLSEHASTRLQLNVLKWFPPNLSIDNPAVWIKYIEGGCHSFFSFITLKNYYWHHWPL